MMNWYSQMVKSQETARERNRREDRRLHLQLVQKHGPEFAAKYRVKELNREQKIISKELDRIRKGVHKPLVNEYSTSHQVLQKTHFSLPVPKSTVIYTHEETNLYKAMVLLQNKPSALIPIVNAHSYSQSYFETLQRITPGLTPEPKRPFVPNYMQQLTGTRSLEENIPLTTKYHALLYRQSPDLRKNSPFTQGKNSPFQRNSPMLDKMRSGHSHQRPPQTSEIQSNDNIMIKNTKQDQDKSEQDVDTDVSDKIIHQDHDKTDKVMDQNQSKSVDIVIGAIPIAKPPDDKDLSLSIPQESNNTVIPFEGQSNENTDRHTTFLTTISSIDGPDASARSFKPELISTSTPTSNRSRQPQDLLTLANQGIQSARESVVQRLSNKEMASTYTKGAVERKTPVTKKNNAGDDDSNENTTEDNKNKPFTATKAVAMFPTYDPEVYCADGSKRKCHELPDVEESFQQARKARYIRSKENAENERELPVEDIFSKC